jgi:hypothetical protein
MGERLSSRSIVPAELTPYRLTPSMTQKSAARTQLYTDKCTQCETYFATTSRGDLLRRLSAHELDAHGTLNPDRPDHRTLDER